MVEYGTQTTLGEIVQSTSAYSRAYKARNEYHPHMLASAKAASRQFDEILIFEDEFWAEMGDIQENLTSVIAGYWCSIFSVRIIWLMYTLWLTSTYRIISTTSSTRSGYEYNKYRRGTHEYHSMIEKVKRSMRLRIAQRTSYDQHQTITSIENTAFRFVKLLFTLWTGQDLRSVATMRQSNDGPRPILRLQADIGHRSQKCFSGVGAVFTEVDTATPSSS